MKGEALKLLEVAIDSGIQVAKCKAAVDAARDALSLANADYDRAKIKHEEDKAVAQRAERALYDAVAKPREIPEGKAEEVTTAASDGLSREGEVQQSPDR